MKELVFELDNQVVVSSRKIAEVFKREHKNILVAIRNILSAEKSANQFYRQTTYKYNNRVLPEYVMNRDGFMLLVMGFNTKDAIKLKAMFIKAFNEMEAKLKGNNIIALDEYNRNIQQLMNKNDEWEARWKKAIPYIKLGAIAYELAHDKKKTELTYAFVQGLKSND